MEISSSARARAAYVLRRSTIRLASIVDNQAYGNTVSPVPPPSSERPNTASLSSSRERFGVERYAATLHRITP
jgi:hypothetical protein